MDCESIFDDEHSEVEDRWITSGLNAAGKLLVVCHAFRKRKADLSVVVNDMLRDSIQLIEAMN